ncbi:Pkinase-domain-containing protein [Nadsonia fulvescens var. elongata DSM 6958]|uniref:Pkinase-domain-containing protein n=1 Tax=Nadsonia fulvescens var. elongata DSM 6958 TaxID=857566 RepID=A0A1E3PHM3_9ASCO|nr:Pkinase-domain-containing protein [Nadsonia fulvescens var. elongata DSM 6958]
MFQNFKNFIRNGKQAHTNNQRSSNISSINSNNQKPLSDSIKELISAPTSHPSEFAPVSNPDSNPVNNFNDDSHDVLDRECYSYSNVAIPMDELSDTRYAPVDGVPKQASTVSAESDKKQAYDQAIQQIIQEENLEKRKMPRYNGLDRYHLLEKMGDGAFSIVYKALDLQTGEKVAVKVVRKLEVNNTQKDRHLGQAARKEKKTSQRSTILKEVAIMRQLKHDNIVELKEFIESLDHYFIVLELLPGGELFHQIVRLTYFSEDLSRHVITQVANAVQYLHDEVGVIHRDIKPENLLFYPIDHIPSVPGAPIRPGEEESKVDEGQFRPGIGSGGIGVIKLADFGLSKVVWDTNTMTPCGTVGYTAPEIVKDQRYSKSVDMWALGCVLYTILCGFPPFYDESIQDLTEKVSKGQYTFLSPWWDDISDSAKDLVSHLLTVNPEDRYSIGEFLNHPWIKNTPVNLNTAPPAYANGISGTNTATNNVNDAVNNANIDRFVNNQTLETHNADGFRSPAAVALKEVFDVSYAVHRMEEENARRNRGGLGFINDIAEDYSEEGEEDEEDDQQDRVGELQDFGNDPRRRRGANDAMGNLQQRLTGVNLGGNGGAMAPNPASTKSRRKAGFELNMSGATLLERRKMRKQQGDVMSIAAVMGH